jgi:hypothetical protein
MLHTARRQTKTKKRKTTRIKRQSTGNGKLNPTRTKRKM